MTPDECTFLASRGWSFPSYGWCEKAGMPTCHYRHALAIERYADAAREEGRRKVARGITAKVSCGGARIDVRILPEEKAVAGDDLAQFVYGHRAEDGAIVNVAIVAYGEKQVAESVAKARREALEEAARVCDELANAVLGDGEYFSGKEAAYEGAADAIRALAEKEEADAET